MKKIATIDFKDYGKYNYIELRKASRAIIIKGNKVLLIKSFEGNYYKFPGGGRKVFETSIDALIRETMEEAGFKIIKSSIKPLGYVEEIKKLSGKNEAMFKMISEYYYCDIQDAFTGQDLDEYEKEAGFFPVLIDPKEAIKINEQHLNDLDKSWIKRENLVLKIIAKLMEA